MPDKNLDIIAIGSCYLDTNVASFPFNRHDLTREEFIGEHYELAPGGSAVNFCRLSQDLGLRTGLIGMSGTDPSGGILEKLLIQQGVQSDLIRRSDLQTNIGFNITNPDGEHTMFVAGTANAALDPKYVLPKLEQILPSAQRLYIGGCFKLVSFVHAFGQIADLANRHKTEIVVDHGRIPESAADTMREAVKELVKRAVHYFPSRDEFCDLWNAEDIEAGLQALHSLSPSLTTIVKDGANGAFYCESGSMQHIEALKVEHVVNSTGAGDSFNAGTITALWKGYSMAESVAYGCKVAAAKISGGGELPRL